MLIYNDYTPIRSLLRIAKESGDCSQYIRMTVEDAIIIHNHPDRIRSIHRETYRYAVKLGRSKTDILDGMHADNLQKAQIIRLLDFFDAL